MRDRCPHGISLAAPAGSRISGASGRESAEQLLEPAPHHRPHWHDGIPANITRALVDGPPAAFVGIWEGKYVMGTQLCEAALELEEVRIRSHLPDILGVL